MVTLTMLDAKLTEVVVRRKMVSRYRKQRPRKKAE